MKKIRFRIEVNRETKEVEGRVECASCGQEVQMKNEAGKVTFLCPTHGESGEMAIERFQNLYAEAERQVAEKEGLGQPAKRTIHHVPTDPDKMN